MLLDEETGQTKIAMLCCNVVASVVLHNVLPDVVRSGCGIGLQDVMAQEPQHRASHVLRSAQVHAMKLIWLNVQYSSKNKKWTPSL